MFPGLRVVGPKYAGGNFRLYDPALDQYQDLGDKARNMIRTHQLRERSSTDYSALILFHLQSALGYIDIQHTRQRAFIESMMGHQYMIDGHYDLALRCYVQASDRYCSEFWPNIAVPILKKRIECATYLGRLEEYVTNAFMLYSLLESSCSRVPGSLSITDGSSSKDRENLMQVPTFA